MVELTIPTILSLAAADAVNPCAIAVLILILLNILVENAKNKIIILKSGLAFCASVFTLYFFYGLIIIQLFKTINVFFQTLAGPIFKMVAVLAIILGLLNIWDYIKYAPGRLGTEMPMGFRPRLRSITKKITTPKGAFLTGIFVTLFLLPCTIGPYIVAGNILSFMEIVKTIPWLILYNSIFILPMIAITIFVYLGVSTLEDINVWKDRNIRYLHLIAGILIILVGILMLIGKL